MLRAVCERSRFWRWLVQGFVEKIIAVFETIGGFPGFIRDPDLERIIGLIFTWTFLVCAVFYGQVWTGITRIALALFSVFSFIIYKHGVYRSEGDC